MRMLIAALAAWLVVGGTPAAAQEVSESVKRTCRSVSTSTARTIAYAIRARVDPATQVKRVADTWLEGVQAHMLLAASRAPHLSEEELSALGFSYCVERRPSEYR